MIAKDTTRLLVLRSLLSQTLNASKTSTPIQTDIQVLSLLRKNAASAKAAATEFKDAGRQDLADKEEAQMKIMDEYAGSVEVVGEEEIRKVVGTVVEGLTAAGEKLGMGDVLKKAFAEFGDRNVEKGNVARVVKEVLAGAAEKS